MQAVLFEAEAQRRAGLEDSGRRENVRHWLEERGHEGRVLTRGLTIWQPWLRMMMERRKRWEFRGWPHGRPGWTIMLHAGKRPDPDWRAIARRYGMVASAPGVLGAVVGVGVLGRCEPLTAPGGWPWPNHELSEVPGYPTAAGDWYAWEWREIVPLIEPVPCRGYQGFWAPSERIRQEVMERILLR